MAKKEADHMAFHKYKSGKMLIIGILILLNATYSVVNWGVFVGGVVALLGLLGLVYPKCPHCK
jgi:hypothetical protein